MSQTAFSRSSQLLRTDNSSGWNLGVLTAVCLLFAWSLWFFLARVAIYAVSDAARLEVRTSAHPIYASVAGRVVLTRLSLGMLVKQGAALVELDAELERRQLWEERTKLAGIGPQLSALRDTLKAEETALNEARLAAKTKLDQARVQSHGADQALHYAKEQATRYKLAREVISAIEILRAEAQEQDRHSMADASRLEIDRLGLEARTLDSDRIARINDVKREATRLEGEKETAAAEVKLLEYEIEMRQIRAPVTGRIAEVSNVHLGSFLGEGERLAAVVPFGEIGAVAEFSPGEAVGRVRVGQLARIRLKGFPSTQYGSLAVRVTNVASEIRDGTIQVRFAINAKPSSLIPIEHGLPGMVEVEVERISPALLTLRAAGQLMAKPIIRSASMDKHP
jgi:multidrug resistance efflux pump